LKNLALTSTIKNGHVTAIQLSTNY